MTIPIKDALIVILGGLFGWVLGQLPKRWIFVVMAVAIVLIILVMRP